MVATRQASDRVSLSPAVMIHVTVEHLDMDLKIVCEHYVTIATTVPTRHERNHAVAGTR